MAIRFETPEERAKRTGEVRSTSDQRKAPTGQIVRKPEPSKLEKAWSALDRHEREAVVVEAQKKSVVRSAKKAGAKSKEMISIRLPEDVLEYFRGTGAGWQKRINDILSDHARKHKA